MKHILVLVWLSYCITVLLEDYITREIILDIIPLNCDYQILLLQLMLCCYSLNDENHVFFHCAFTSTNLYFARPYFALPLHLIDNRT